jgi:hypothetical protein
MPLLWCNSELTDPGNLKGLRKIVPVLLLWQHRQQSRKNLEKKLALPCGDDITVNLCISKLYSYQMSTWQISAEENQGILLFTDSLSCSDLGVEYAHRALGPLWLGSHCADKDCHLTVSHKLPWFHCLTLTTWPHCVILTGCQGRNEVTWVTGWSWTDFPSLLP